MSADERGWYPTLQLRGSNMGQVVILSSAQRGWSGRKLFQNKKSDFELLDISTQLLFLSRGFDSILRGNEDSVFALQF